jgi:Rnl2 family RNA ligase
VSLPPAAWPFATYEKIAESLAAWLGEDEAAYRALRGAEWVVTEKIHGANFCLVTDGVTIRAAKRKGFLAPGEDFFGHEAVVERLGPSVLRLAGWVLEQAPGASLVYVHGELFGGAYPHPDVAPDPAVQAAQTGCWYSPTLELAAFDVSVLSDGGRAYLDHDDAARLFAEAGLFHLHPLFRGPYEEAMSFPLGFDSGVPAALGLPPLPQPNPAEGVVLKPARAVRVPRRPGLLRPVVKRKIPEFSEDARFHAAEKWAARPALHDDAGALEVLKQEASALAVDTRLDAAVSKVGRVGPGDTARAGEVLVLLVEDVYAELGTRLADSLRALPPAGALDLRRHVEGEARALVELYLGVSPP